MKALEREIRELHKANEIPRGERDEVLSVEIERVWQVNLQVWGAQKVWGQLRREGTDVARCTVERPMRRAGLHRVMRGMVAHYAPG